MGGPSLAVCSQDINTWLDGVTPSREGVWSALSVVCGFGEEVLGLGSNP